jgi:hypothetical protein
LEFLVGQMLDQLREDGSASVHSALLLNPVADASRWKNRSDFKSFPAMSKSK